MHRMQIAGSCIGALMHNTFPSNVTYYKKQDSPRFLEVMAANKDMQMKKYDLLCLLREDKAFEIEGVRKHCEMKLADSISKSKAWNPFSRGKNGRDLSTELLIPKHITEKWQSGELRALK